MPALATWVGLVVALRGSHHARWGDPGVPPHLPRLTSVPRGRLEEAAQDLQEHLGLLGVHPVAGLLDRHQAVGGEPGGPWPRRTPAARSRSGLRPSTAPGPGTAEWRRAAPAATRRSRGVPHRAPPGWPASASRRRPCGGSAAGRRAPSGRARPSRAPCRHRHATPASRGPAHAWRRRIPGTPTGGRRRPVRRRPRRVARRARGDAAPAPSRPCPRASGRPGPRGRRRRAARRPGRRPAGSRTCPPSPSGRGEAGRRAAPGGGPRSALPTWVQFRP